MFDFYGVWLPDIFSDYLYQAQQYGPEAVSHLEVLVGQYFQGEIDIEEVAAGFRYTLSRPDIDSNQFRLNEQSISPAIVTFMRELHSHFLKLGVLANLGRQETQLLTDFNQHNQLFEIIAGPFPLHINAPLLSNEIFSKALQLIGEPPRSCLVVTSNAGYQSFAAGLGMTVLPFQGFPKLRQDLDQILSSDLAN